MKTFDNNSNNDDVAAPGRRQRRRQLQRLSTLSMSLSTTTYQYQRPRDSPQKLLHVKQKNESKWNAVLTVRTSLLRISFLVLSLQWLQYSHHDLHLCGYDHIKNRLRIRFPLLQGVHGWQPSNDQYNFRRRCSGMSSSQTTKENCARQAMRRHGSFSSSNGDDKCGDDILDCKNGNGDNPIEYFSVAPMMGHTNRHYRYFFRQLNPYAFIYTEMIPAGQIVQAYYHYVVPSNRRHGTSGTDTGTNHPPNDNNINQCHHTPEQIYQEVNIFLARQQVRPDFLLPYNVVLDELMFPCGNIIMNDDENGIGADRRIVLQLGGRDQTLLAQASAIGAAFGYAEINLNCGCPSTSVAAGLQTGAALMKEPELVMRCLESMSIAMESIATTCIDRCNKILIPVLSVKHRLGVVDNARLTYNAVWDRQQNDDEAYESCFRFVNKIVDANSILSKVHVHARLALLGLDSNGNDDGDDDDDDGNEGDRNQAETGTDLWIPQNSKSNASNIIITKDKPESTKKKMKINHKRVQYQAKRKARSSTIQNRDVPPLRPGVVERIATEFSSSTSTSSTSTNAIDRLNNKQKLHVPPKRTLQVITNGGIMSPTDLHQRINGNVPDDKNYITGGMVGRAVINHPCSFSGIGRYDSDGNTSNDSGTSISKNDEIPPTRRQVLQRYIAYCEREEERLHQYVYQHQKQQHKLGGDFVKNYRKKLIAAAFHLFMGMDQYQADEGIFANGDDDGGGKNASYQRRLRKLVSRGDRHPSPDMISAAMAEVDDYFLDTLKVTDFVDWKDISTYSEFGTKRSGSMQRTIY